MWYYTSGNTQIRVAFTAAMMKLKGAKIPPTIVFPIQLQNQRVRDSCVKGYPQEASRDIAHPAEPAQSDVPVGGSDSHAPEPSENDVDSRAREPLRAVASRRVEGVRSGAGAPRGQRRLPRRRDPRARRGERVREIDIARDRERLRPSRRREPSRSAASSAGAVSPAETRRLGLGMAYQTYSHVLDLSVAENLYLAAPAGACGRRTDGWRSGRPRRSPSSTSTSR